MFDSAAYNVCMKGSIHFRKDRGTWIVNWWHSPHNRSYTITRYKGQIMYDKRMAEKLLSMMQGDTENNVFRIEKYIKQGFTDTIPYLQEWLDLQKDDISPATFKDYRNSINNHLIPFFQKNNYQLHEIQYDVLRKLLKSISRSGKGKMNVMYCLHTVLSFAWKSKKIPAVPPFPEKKYYQLQEKNIEWLPENRQLKVLEQIPEEDKPIFYWLKYHLRRPCEAMALHKADYDKENEVFIIRRSISNRKIVDKTKTGKTHIIPVHPEFKKFIKVKSNILSQFYFTCSRSGSVGRRYTDDILQRIWKKACKAAGENITLYQGLKHSSMTQLAVEHGFSDSEIQMLSDHDKIESIRKYRKMEVAIKRNLQNRTITKRLPVKKQAKNVK